MNLCLHIPHVLFNLGEIWYTRSTYIAREGFFLFLWNLLVGGLVWVEKTLHLGMCHVLV
jgi:hypothetical protein